MHPPTVAVFLTMDIFFGGFSRSTAQRDDELQRATDWLKMFNDKLSEQKNKMATATWNFELDMTKENEKVKSDATIEMLRWYKSVPPEAARFNVSKISDPVVRRALTIVQMEYKIDLDDADVKELMDALSRMANRVISPPFSATWVDQPFVSWALDNFLDIHRNLTKLEYYWVEWLKGAAKPNRDDFEKTVSLLNKGARSAGYDDVGAQWRSMYEWDVPGYDLSNDMYRLIRQLLPLYEQLHTYVHRKLVKHFGYDGKNNLKIHSTAIPAHILGSIYAENWVNVYDLTKPYGSKSPIDATEQLIQQGYTVERMVNTADTFFKSLGFQPLKQETRDCFTLKAPKGKTTNCHPGAIDFNNGKKFCMKMCPDTSMQSLVMIHHELGHIQDYIQHAEQPTVFRGSANPGFTEAIGDTLALSVATPEHLKHIGLLPDYQYDDQQDINFLYRQALKKVATLPFAYVLENWRWDVFNSTVRKDQWNQHYWDLQFQYRGLVPPVPRSNDDFDPGAKLGRSKPWPEALKMMTGKYRLDASAILEYFNPLMKFLEENAGECFGWGYKWEFNDELPQPRCGCDYPPKKGDIPCQSSTRTIASPPTGLKSTASSAQARSNLPIILLVFLIPFV